MAPKHGPTNGDARWESMIDPGGNFRFEAIENRHTPPSAMAPGLTRDIRIAGRRQKLSQRVQQQAIGSIAGFESRRAYNAFRAAAADIERGNYSIDRINNEMYDSYETDVEESFEVPTGEDAVEMSSDQLMLKGNKGVAQSVLYAGNAQLRGMSSLASELARVQTRNSEAMSRAIGASVNQGAALITNTLYISNGKLDKIDSSIQALLNFHNQNTSKYYTQSLAMANGVGKMLESFQKTLAPSKREERRFNFDGGIKGFFKGYVDYVTSGIMETVLGSLSGGLGGGKTLSTIAGGAPIGGMKFGTKAGGFIGSLTKMVAKSFLPRSITDRIDAARMDFRNITDELLEQISDRFESSKNPLLQSLAGVFGNRRSKINAINMGAYSKDPIPWNGLAQKAVTEVIPELLTQINTSINKGKTEDRYYDYNSGKFMTRSQIQQRYDTEYRDRINASMNPAIQKLTDALEASGKTQSEQTALFKEISALFDDMFAGKDIRTTRKEIRGKLDQFGLEGQVAQAIEREVSTGFRNAIRQINDLNNDIQTTQSVYRNLSNRQDQPDLVESKRVQHRDRRGQYNYRSFDRDPKQVIRETQNRLGIKDVDLTRDITLQQNVLNVLFTGLDTTAEQTMLEDLVQRAADKASGNTSPLGRIMNGPTISKVRGGISGGLERIDNGTVSNVLDYMTSKFQDIAFNAADNLTGEAVKRKLSQVKTKFTRRQPEESDEGLGSGRGFFDRRRSLGYGPGAATTFYTEKNTPGRAADKTSGNTERVEKIAMTPMDKLSPGDIANNDNIINGAINDLQKEDQTGGSLQSTIVQAANAVRTSLGAMVGKFIGWGASIFGKEGKLSKLWNSDARKKLTGRLFTDEDAIFGAQYQMVKDWGRDIWKRTKDELAKGYDYVRDSALQFKFGKDYREKEAFQNSKFWNQYTDRGYWIDKIQQAKEKAAQRKTEREEAQKTAIIQDLETEEPEEEILSEKEILEDEALGNGPGDRATRNYAKYNRRKKRATVAKFWQWGTNLRNWKKENLYQDYVLDIADTAENVKDNIRAVGEAVVGDLEEDPNRKRDKIAKQYTSDMMTRLKSRLPKALAGGIAGAGIGLLNATNSSLLGSLLGPMGPISGAIVGAGLSILTKSEAFQNIMFGKLNEETGEREGGLITQQMREKFKSVLPSVVGGAAVGALRGILKSAIGFNSGVGVMGMQLLPGGILGGAIIGAGIGLLKNSDKFKDLLFGKANDDGTRTGTFLSNSFNKIRGIFGGDAKQALFKGLTGAGVGALTGTVLAHAGFLPAMLSAGGPIGLGIAGLGLGIASTTKRFNEYIFGSEYTDEEGKTRRREDGLLSKVRNLINVNMVEPISNAFKSKMLDLVDWTKDKITMPFKLAFGPIIDNFKKIGEDIREFAKERMEKFGRTLYNMTFGLLGKLFKPFTKLIGGIGKLGASALAGGAKLLLSPVSALAQGARLLTSRTRRKQEKSFRGKYNEYLDSEEGQNAVQEYMDILEDDGKGGKNRLNFIQRGMIKRDIRKGRGEFAEAFRSGYNEEMTAQDLNALNWRDEVMKKYERRDARRARHAEEKMWDRDIYKIRQDIINRDLKGNSGVTLTDAAVANYREKFAKKGIDPDWLQTSEDVMQLLYHPDEFRARMNGVEPDREKGTNEADVADAVNEAEAAQKLRDERRDALLEKIVADLGGSEAAKQVAQERLDASIAAQEAHERTKLAKRIKNAGIKGIDVNDPRLKAFNLEQIDRATLENFRPTIQTGNGKRYAKADVDQLLKYLQDQHIEPIGGWTNLNGPVPEGTDEIPDVNGASQKDMVSVEMARYYLSDSKISLKTVGERFGLSAQTVSKYFKERLPNVDRALAEKASEKLNKRGKKTPEPEPVTEEATLQVASDKKTRTGIFKRLFTRKLDEKPEVNEPELVANPEESIPALKPKGIRANLDMIKQMAQMYLSDDKITLAEVGEKFGLSAQTVSKYLKEKLPEIDEVLSGQFLEKLNGQKFKKKVIDASSKLKDRLSYINTFVDRYKEKESARLEERDRFKAFGLTLPGLNKSYWNDLEERQRVHEYFTGLGFKIPGGDNNPFNVAFPGQALNETESEELQIFKNIKDLISQILGNSEERKTLSEEQHALFEEIASNTSDQAELAAVESGIETTGGKKSGRIRQWLSRIFSKRRTDARNAREAGETAGRATGRQERKGETAVDANGNPIVTEEKESFWSRLLGGLKGFGSKAGTIGKFLGKGVLKLGIVGLLGGLGFTVAELIKPGTVSTVGAKIQNALNYMNDENGGIGGIINTAREKFNEFWDKKILGWWNGSTTEAGEEKEGFKEKLKKIWNDGNGGGIWGTLSRWKEEFLKWLPGAAASFAGWFKDNTQLITSTVTSVAKEIAWPMAQLIWSLVKGLASGIWSGITGKSVGNLSEDDVAILESHGINVNENVRKTTETKEAAESYADRKNLTNAQIVENEDGTYSVIEYRQPGKRSGLDKKGRETKVARGQVIGTTARQLVMSQIFPKATKSGAKIATLGVTKLASGATKLISKIPGLGLVGKVGTVGIKAGEVAAKGGGKILSKLASKFGVKAAEKVGEEVVEETVEAAAKGAANTGARLVLSTGETAVQNSAGRWINELTKKFVSSKLIEEATEKGMAESVEAAAKGAVELGAQSAAGKAVEEVGEAGAKTALKSLGEWVAKIATSDGLKKAIEKIVPGGADGIVATTVKSLGTVVSNAAKATGKTLRKIGDIVKSGIAKLTGDSGAFLFKLLFSMTVGAVFGAIDAATLFGVDKSGVDGTMVLVSSIFGALLGFPWIGTILDIVMSICTVFGWNIKQDLATAFYKILVGNDEKKVKNMELSRNQQDLERQIYNALNDTNLDQNAYNDLNNNLITKGVNWVKGIFGRGAAWTKSSEQALAALRNSGMTDDEISELAKDQIKLNSTLASLGYGSGAKISGLGYGKGQNFTSLANNFWSKNSSTFDRAATYVDAGGSTPKIGTLESIDRTIKGIYSIIKAYTRVGVSNMEYTNSKDKDETAIGYGNGDFDQANGRWANKRIGTFRDGRPATMKDSGCGPTALAMVADQLGIGHGPGISPYQVANITRDTLASDGAATARTLTIGAARLGMSSRPLGDVNGVASSLQHNRPVILTGHGGSGTPYTNAGHIVVADKLLSNGRVRVRNPMGGGSSNYSLNTLKNYTDTAFSMGLGRGPKRSDRVGEDNEEPTSTNPRARYGSGSHTGQTDTGTSTHSSGSFTDDTHSSGTFSTDYGADFTKLVVNATANGSSGDIYSTVEEMLGHTTKTNTTPISSSASSAIDIDRLIVQAIAEGASDPYAYVQEHLASPQSSAISSLNETKEAINKRISESNNNITNDSGFTLNALSMENIASTENTTSDEDESEGNRFLNLLSKLKSAFGTIFEKLTGFSASLFGLNTDDDDSSGGLGIIGGSTYKDTEPISGNDVSRFLQVLRTQVGYLEKNTNASLLDFSANPGNRNYNKYVNEMSSGVTTKNPWCAYLVSWAAKAADIPATIIPRIFSCTNLLDAAVQTGTMRYRGEYTPVPGDLILYNWAGVPNPKAATSCDHVGVVEYVDGNKVHTIEGNTSPGGISYEGVYRKQRDINAETIVGYIHPKWRDEVKTVEPSTLLKYSNLVNGSRQVATDNGGGSSGNTVTGTGSGLESASVVDISSGDIRENVWKYLRSVGFSAKAAAGIMGNWKDESGVNPRRIEADYLKSFPGFNSLKTASDLDNYTQNFLFPAYERSGISIAKSGYKGSDGKYYPGMGMAQWTGPRAQKMMSYMANNNLDTWDLASQLKFFTDEVNSNYTSLLSKLNAQDTPTAAAAKFLDTYEMYDGFAAKSPKTATSRGNNAEAFYQQFKDTSLGYGTGDTQINDDSGTSDAELLKALGLRDGMNVNVDSTAIVSVLTRIADVMNTVVKNQETAAASSRDTRTAESNVTVNENRVVNNINQPQTHQRTNQYQNAIVNQHALLSYRQNVVRSDKG